MKKIKITEGNIRRMVTESVKRILKEEDESRNVIDKYYDGFTSDVKSIMEDGIEDLNNIREQIKSAIQILPGLINKATNGVMSNAVWTGDLPSIAANTVEQIEFIADAEIEDLMSIPQYQERSEGNVEFLPDTFNDIMWELGNSSGLNIRNASLYDGKRIHKGKEGKTHIYVDIELESHSEFWDWFDWEELEKKKYV